VQCPDCQAQLRQTDYRGVRIDECPQCRGRWFDRDELRRAKDCTDQDLRWLDFDPFARNADTSPDTPKGRLCPRCSVAMGVIAYETSGVLIDKCAGCHGVWLDHGEFEKIVKHLEHEVSSEPAAQYRKDAEKQFAQIVTGPEGPVSELRDFFAVLNLLEMRLAVEHPTLASLVEAIYLASPFK
jgi:Zn-finger nucleic acid-binding protein